MTNQRWRRGESRDRVVAATVAAVADVGPGGVSGRSIARAAGVHHAQIQQMFGSVDDLVAHAVVEERDRFIGEAFGESGSLPDPLAIADYPEFWRAIGQVLLDPGPVELSDLAQGGPVDLIRQRLAATEPAREPGLVTAIAAAWAATPLGALIFAEPLRNGLSIADRDWARCWARLGDRVCSLAGVAFLPEAAGPAHLATPMPDAHAGDRGRERLLRASETLLETRLETAVTGRELAAAAHVNYGLVNHYFGSKTAVFDEALIHLHQRFLDDVLEIADPLARGALDVFARHRAFLRAWAGRLLGGRPTPDFKLLGMERLLTDVVDARGIDQSNRSAWLDAAGDAMSSIALQLGWTILQPLPSAVDPNGMDEIVGHLDSIGSWMLRPLD